MLKQHSEPNHKRTDAKYWVTIARMLGRVIIYLLILWSEYIWSRLLSTGHAWASTSVRIGKWSYSRRCWTCCKPTCDVIHLIGPRTSLTVCFTAVRWPGLVVGLLSCWAWETLTAVLHCEHLVTSLQGHQVTLVDGILAGVVRVLQEGILTLHGGDGKITIILETAECSVWLNCGPNGEQTCSYLFTPASCCLFGKTSQHIHDGHRLTEHGYTWAYRQQTSTIEMGGNVNRTCFVSQELHPHGDPTLWIGRIDADVPRHNGGTQHTTDDRVSVRVGLEYL